MAAGTGWRALRGPAPLRLGSSPMARLALTHGLSVAGDTLVTMALAGSLFFSIDPQLARGRVALYLLLTMAPFAVVAPLLGPLLDRGRGRRRLMLTLSAASRAVLCLSMARHLDDYLLFPEAFVLLVLSKTHLVTKSALVPVAVGDRDDLVEANARLAVLSVVAGFVAAAPGLLVLKISALGSPWAMRLAAVVFAAAALTSLRLPAERSRAVAPASSDETAKAQAADLVLSGTVMAVLRAVVGFLTFLLAFDFRRSDAPSWWFGLVLSASLGGSFLGAVVAPRLRRRVAEERILSGALLLVVAAGLVGARTGGLAGAAPVALAVGLAAGAAKVAFDAIVQRDAPEAVRGRSFARFETRFQLAWVLGAFVPVVLPVSLRLGMALVSLGSAVTALAYVGRRRAASQRHPPVS